LQGRAEPIERSTEYRSGNIDAAARYDEAKHNLEIIIDKTARAVPTSSFPPGLTLL
jgi:hypothetical protein